MAAITSPHRGVHWHTRERKWVAGACVRNHKTFLGFHDTEQEAADAVARFHRERMHGLDENAPWQSLVVASLCESKAQLRSFRVARKIAENAHPPRARDVGSSDALFDDRGEPEESVYDAFWRFCEAEYEGHRTTRHRFSWDMLSAPDWSGPAGVVRQAS